MSSSFFRSGKGKDERGFVRDSFLEKQGKLEKAVRGGFSEGESSLKR